MSMLPAFKYFTQAELENGQKIPEDLYKFIIPAAMILDSLREKIREPIYINSTYRDPEYNKAVGGAKKSLHMHFNAVDFTVKRDSRLRKMQDMVIIYNLLKQMDKKGQLYPTYGFMKEVMGLGLYIRGKASFIHIDTRGLIGYNSPTRWLG